MKHLYSFLSLSLLVSTSSYANSSFDLKPYLEKCGGKVYSKCDAAPLDQSTIFEAARAQALKDGKQILAVIGADWCPACRNFNEMLKTDADSPRFYEQFTVVELNGDLSSTKNLAKRLKFTYMGYPQAFLINPEDNMVGQQLYPSLFPNVAKLLDVIGKPVSAPKIEKPFMLSNIYVSTIEKAIPLNDDYGTSPFYAQPQSEAEKYVNQGVAAMHVYHYVDAYRSFKEAERRDPNIVMAHVGQILAIPNLGYGEAVDYFAYDSLKKIETIAKTRQLTPAEKAWADFGRSIHKNNSSNYVNVPGQEVPSLYEAYKKVVATDPQNLDGHGLIAWLAAADIGEVESKGLYKYILTKLPTNVGAHHALLHIAEGESDGRTAVYHATHLARLAPRSAHAQHMYAHTQPQLGKWNEALTYFKRADDLTHEWAKKNGLTVDQDWHYAHNLDLMAATYLGLGEFTKARDTFEKATSDYRAILHSVQLSVAIDDFATADSKLKKYEDMGLKDYLKPLRNELQLTAANAGQFTSGITDESKIQAFDALLLRLIRAGASKKADATLNQEIVDHLAGEFKKGGFDGWSNAYLQMLRFKRVARIVGIVNLETDLKPLEFTLSTGALCSSGQPNKSEVKCLPTLK